ncbi:MAG: hypothetical protein O2960_16635 [Verrucomicrobia bacterium]|nr:hypothetical protein [Verrucomicrobiota bacterium]
MMDRAGRRLTLLDDPDICLHSPMLVKPRLVPPVIAEATDRNASTGRFLVQDVYQGLEGVKRGDVKWLRVIEETSRVSASTMGGSPYNQTFLVSAALAFSVKNYLGVAPVSEEGSAYFEVPAGRALYLQALDGDGRLVQSMRSFIQAAPGTTRSCVGCHENRSSAPSPDQRFRRVLAHPPSRLQPESWGGGYLDYPTMVQPILDRHCVSCHGGAREIAAGLDLTGGWTEHFSISYENLVSRRESQLVNGYAHAVKPVDAFPRRTFRAPDRSGSAVISFSSTQSESYQAMLAIVRNGRELALAEPRVDMPGGEIIPGESRQLIAVSAPERWPALRATETASGVRLSWDRRADLSGLKFELHRSEKPGFTPEATTRLVSLTRFDYFDVAAPSGVQHYALISDGGPSPAARATVMVTGHSRNRKADARSKVRGSDPIRSSDRSSL